MREHQPDGLVEREHLGPGDLDQSVNRLGKRYVDDRARHVVSRHRAELHRRQMHCAIDHRELRDAAQEFVELRGVDQREGMPDSRIRFSCPALARK